MQDLLAMRCERLTQPRVLDVLQLIEQFSTATLAVQQLLRTDRADARNARQVVGWITDQRHVRRQKSGFHSETSEDRRLVIDDGIFAAATHEVDAHRAACQLQQIAIPAHDQGRRVQLARAVGEGGQDVIGLETWAAKRGNAERVEQLLQATKLSRKQGRRGGTTQLIALEGLMPKRGLGGVEGERQRGPALLAQQLEE